MAKKIFIALGIVAILTIIFFAIRSVLNRTKNTSEGSSDSNSSGSSSSGSSASSLWMKEQFPLKLFMEGEKVKDVQNALNKFLSASNKLTVDGKYGYKTEQAVKAAQKQLNLPINGQVSSSDYNTVVLSTLSNGNYTSPSGASLSSLDQYLYLIPLIL